MFSFFETLECTFFHNLYVAPKKNKTAATLWNVSWPPRHKNHGQQRTFGRAMLRHGGFFPPRLSKKGDVSTTSRRTICVGFMASALKVLNDIMIGKSLCGEFNFVVKFATRYKKNLLLRFNKIWSSNFHARKDL